MALVRLVGAVQDLLEASGYSVSRLIDGLVQKQGRLARIVRGVAATAVPGGTAMVKLGNVTGGTRVSMALMLRMLALFGIKQEFISSDNLAKLFKRLTPTIAKILQGDHVDLRPAVSAVIMALNPPALRAFAQSTLQGVLNTYVYAQYKSSSQGSTMCTLCAQADCARVPSKVKSNAPASMAKVVEKTVWSINRLLEVEGRGHTLTSVLRQAIDSNLDPTIATAVEWGARLTGPRTIAVVGVIVRALYPILSKRLSALGLIISKNDFSTVVLKELHRVQAFLAKQPGANLEPFIVKLVAAASPIGIVQGAIASTRRNASPNQFCKFCSSMYGSCVRA